MLVPRAFDDRELAELALGELRMAAADKPTVCIYLFEMIADVGEALAGSGRDRHLIVQASLLVLDAEHAGLPEHELHRLRQAFTARFARHRPEDAVNRSADVQSTP